MMQRVSFEHCSGFFRQWRTGNALKQVAGEVSMTPGADIDQWLVSLMDYRRKPIHRRGRNPVPIDLCATEGKIELTFSVAQTWRPSAYERSSIALLALVPLSTAAAAVTTKPWPTGRHPGVIL